MPRPLPKSIDETHTLLGSADYVADRSLATALYLSLAMQRPLFLEGDRGARAVVDRDPARVEWVTLDRPMPPDVDTPGDYEKIRSALRPANPPA